MTLVIRESTLEDLNDTFLWRNDPLSCLMSVKSDLISIEQHKKWYLDCLVNALIKIYIGIIDGEKVGACRFVYDELDNCADVSINLNPKLRGQKISHFFLLNSIAIYEKNNFYKLKATIKKENIASLKIFNKCKFLNISEDRHFFYLIRS